MKKNIESYKRNEKGNLEITYIVKNTENNEIKVVQEYSKEEEKKLLVELKKIIEKEIFDYPKKCLKSNVTVQNTINSLCMLGLSIINNSSILGTATALISLKFISDILEEYKEIKTIEKYSYYISNETYFNNFNKNIGIVKSKIDNPLINKKIKKLSLDGEKLNIISVSNFSKKELEKIKNATNKLV